jgi:drug/metabolite transporter (DMT)-like permease
VRRAGPSVMFGLAAALGFGGFLVAIDAGSEGGVVWALLFAKLTALGAFLAIVPVRRPAIAITRRDLPALALIGSLMVSADALYAIASTTGRLSAVAALSSLYPIVTIALARVYLHERLERVQQLGAVLALCGVAAISALPG